MPRAKTRTVDVAAEAAPALVPELPIAREAKVAGELKIAYEPKVTSEPKIVPEPKSVEPVDMAAETVHLERIAVPFNNGAENLILEIPHDYSKIEFSKLTETGLAKETRTIGVGNFVYLGPGSDIARMRIENKGNDNTIIVGRNANLKGFISIRGSNQFIVIGSYTTFNNVTIICKYGGNVFIGKDCMFSSGIEVRTSDSHAIVDTDKLEKVNHSASVYIGDHVWVGKNAVMQKGALVGDDSVIGMSSFVNGVHSEPNTILAGAPAKVVRRSRTWSRNELVDPKSPELYAWKALPLL